MKKFMRIFGLVLVLQLTLFFFSTSVSATSSEIDQRNVFIITDAYQGIASPEISQIFTPNINGTLDFVQIQVYNFYSNATTRVCVTIRDVDENGKPATALASSGCIDGFSGPFHQATFATPPLLQAGKLYAISVSGWYPIGVYYVGGNTYQNGYLYMNNAIATNYDMGFVTYMTRSVYSVNFYNFENQIYSSQEIPYGNSASEPDKPLKIGYIFKGWESEFSYITGDLEIHPLYVIDNDPPLISGVYNDENYNTAKQIYFNEGTASLDGQAFLSGDLVTAEGMHTVIVTDEAGNISIVSFNIDQTAPRISFEPYSTTPTNQNITVNALTNEGSLNTTSHTFTENGSFDFIATDAAGNVTTKTVTITNIDKTAPMLTTLSISSNHVYTGGTVTINGTASDAEGNGIKAFKIFYKTPVSGNLYELIPGSGDGSPYGSSQTTILTFDATSELGVWMIDHIYLEDNLGNSQIYDYTNYDIYTSNFSLSDGSDIMAPTIDISVDKPTVLSGQPIIVSWTANDAGMNGIQDFIVTYKKTATKELLILVNNQPGGADLYGAYWGTSFIPDIPGIWAIDSVYVSDGLGNSKTYNNSNYDFSGAMFTVSLPVLPPEAPTGVIASSASYNSAKVTWGAIKGVDGYEVYRALSRTATYKLAGTVTTPSFLNTSLTTGTTYCYKALSYKVVDSVKIYSDYSATACAQPVPSNPTRVQAISDSYFSIRINWTAVTGANGYDIYRSTTKFGFYAMIGTTTTISFLNTGLTTGKVYYYKMKAYRTVGTTKVYSGDSMIASAAPIPSTPSVTVTSVSSTSLNISWASVIGASGYEVYRSTTKLGTYTMIKTLVGTSFTNSGLTTGKSYYYKVRAYRIFGTAKVYGNLTGSFSAAPR